MFKHVSVSNYFLGFNVCESKLKIYGSEAKKLSFNGSYTQVLKRNKPVWEHETKQFYVFVAKDYKWYWYIGTEKDFDQNNNTRLAWTTFDRNSPCPYSSHYAWKVWTLGSNSSWKAVSKSELRLDSVGKQYKTSSPHNFC